MKSKTPILMIGAILAVVIVLVVGIFYALLSEPDSGPTPDTEITTSPFDPTVEKMPGSEMVSVDEDPVAKLERYKKWAQYPPSSRPLYAWQEDLTNPFEFKQPPRGVIQKPAEGCEMTKDGVPNCDKPAQFAQEKCEMWAERSISVGTGDFHVYLRCGDEKGNAVKIQDIQPKVYTKLFRQTKGTLPPIGFGDDGENGDEKANDGIYTFLVRPTANDWGDMYLEADMVVNGNKHNQRAGWFSTPHTVATFGTNITDSLSQGSLEVRVPVTIKKPGYYQFDANLQQKDGKKEFVATSSWQGKLEAGSQDIPLVFFGKILKDRGIDGPYVVRDIRGRRNNSAVTPDMVEDSFRTGESVSGKQTEPLWEYIQPAEDHTTTNYRASDFSGNEWNSEEKQNRIEFLQKLVNE
ncbi:MAG: hypothetical protein KDK37_02125 [Leptospiraceae bacterium]|nr:hypothetical protein [Leptospiraceae bacterium]